MLTLGSILEQNAKKYHNKRAVIFKDKVLTYGELNERANKVANSLSDRGFKKGDKIAVFMKNHLVYAELIVGFAKAGIIMVPINYRLVGAEIDYLINNSDSTGIIFTEEYVDVIKEILPGLPQLDTVIIVGDSTSENMISYEELLDNGDSSNPEVDIKEEDPLYLGYTSGTTGNPKGIVISHRSRVLTGMAVAYEFKLDESDIHLVGGPIYHAAPLIFLLTQLIVGGTIIIHETFRPNKVLADIASYQITNTFLTPTMHAFLVEVQEKVKADISSMRVLSSGGAPLPTQIKKDILNTFPDAGLHEWYGTTESALTLNMKPKDIHHKDQSVGHPFPFVECVILDDKKQPVQQGEIGELYFKAPYLLTEYYKNPEETEAGFHEGYFSVGDMAMQDEEGFYYIVDRKKDMLISGGVNIYPREIEDVLHMNPKIKDVAVLGVPDPVWGESVKAFIVAAEGKSLTEKEVITYCEGKIASYKKPKSVSFVKEIPRNPSGKALKTELRASIKVGGYN
ncbi:class I adenylate-forming enzyme family protein [Sporosarcina soli]|uniref:Class I adenylate-forming enzyme family protein n=1 Tax=Sporosarcina soli TaxID=334736 RepID=A0ABW0TNS1_9BACL